MSDNQSPFHRGEKELQSRLGMRDKMERMGQRMIHPHMTDQHQEFFSQLPILLVGTVDDAGRPWASVLTGQPGFMQATDVNTLRVTAQPIYGDPLNKSLGKGADIGTLGIESHTRRRNRLNGTVAQLDENGFEIHVAQSFGNCPKYIQARELVLDNDIDNIGEKRPVRRGNALNRVEAALVARADTFFIASQFSENGGWAHGVDVSHRGGRPGFVIVAHETSLLFPDYSGNCMFNTLGNLLVNPRSGLLFIDFATGDTIQITGEAEVLWETYHSQRFPGAKRVVAFRVEETLFIEKALPVSWTFCSYSPEFDDFEPLEFCEPVMRKTSQMKLLSVNVSMPKEIAHENKPVTTGIFKKPVESRVMLHRLNLSGDGQADLWGHGGSFRTVYVYSKENYEYWNNELNRDDVTYGQFGENFTVEGMLDDEICIGDVFRIGNALVEVSQPRIPCYKLAIKMGIDGFQNRFLMSGRVGFYFRVIEEGEVGEGDIIEFISRDPNGLTVQQVSNLLFFDKTNLQGTEKALSIPALSHGWKGSFEERLAKKTKAIDDRDKGFRRFVVDRKIAESETIVSFYLLADDDEPLNEFLPGQFLTFKLDIPGQSSPLIRTYSLSDWANPNYYRVSIKRELPPSDQPDLPPGLSSNYFHDHVEVATALKVGRPRGKFHLNLDCERAVVLLSAGVGLTPMISMMNSIIQSGGGRQVWFIHGTRNGHEHAMARHVRQMVQKNDNVNAHICYSNPDADDIEGEDFDSVGRINMKLLKRLLPFDDYEFYLCGPPPFMKSLYCGLLSLGIVESRIHYEFFSPGSLLVDEATPRGSALIRSADQELSGEFQVTFARSGVTAAWAPECETILELAEQNGLSPDYSCRSGICHTCMCELVEGEVEYVEEPLDMPVPGHVLICCCRPKSKLVIEV